METVVQAYRFALDPTPAQEQALASHAGAARFAYNALLAMVQANVAQRAAERSYGIEDADLTPAVGWSAYSLRRALNAVKNEIAPWWQENSKEAFATGAANLARALANWSASRKGTRAGRASGFPQFKRKGRTVESCTFTTGNIHVTPDRHSATLPRIGRIHTHESTRKLARRLEAGTARITTATISHRAGRWYVSFTAHVDRRIRSHRAPGTVVGVDVGVKDLVVAATADGTEVTRVPVPATVRAVEARKQALQRRARHKDGPRRGHAPSNRWLCAQKRISRLDARSAAIRRDALHKTTTSLARSFETVVVEDLNVTGMLTAGGAHKRGLNRGIARAAMSTIHQMLTYKTSWNGGSMVLADRWYPSSKTCSGCGAVKAKLALSERTYACTTCGCIIDRDLNAAVNLSRLAVTGQASHGREWPGDRTWSHAQDHHPTRVLAAGCEASTPPGDRVLATAPCS